MENAIQDITALLGHFIQIQSHAMQEEFALKHQKSLCHAIRVILVGLQLEKF
jgi:hypothetical protein